MFVVLEFVDEQLFVIHLFRFLSCPPVLYFVIDCQPLHITMACLHRLYCHCYVALYVCKCASDCTDCT